jgi:hypothetical protein
MEFLMRFLIPIAILGLAGCSATDNQEKQSSDSDLAAPASGAAMVPGLYNVGDETTVYGSTLLNEDGTYVDLNGEERVGGGAWRSNADEICFDPEGDGEDQQERCWINGPVEEDGSLITTRTDGSESYRVTPITE